MVVPGFTKGGGGGGGRKIMNACCLYDHTFIYHQNHKMGGGQT